MARVPLGKGADFRRALPLGLLGERLKAYRWTRGMTQEEMARHLGLDPSTLARWERGKSFTAEDVLKRAGIKWIGRSSP